MNAQGLYGAQQGPSGVSQGYKGTQEALSNGASTGMERAASGGMEPSQPGQTSPTRKTMGLFSFLAPLASLVPGVGPLLGAGLSAIGNMQAQDQAKSAAAAAQAGQGGALAGASGIASNLTGSPDYSGIIRAENSGINALRSGVGGVANPNAVVGDMAGQSLETAISGANQDRDANLKSAAGILDNTGRQYNQIGQQAGAAANAQANPFSLFSNALSGAGGLAGILGGLGGSGGGGGAVNTNPGAGGINLSSGINNTPAPTSLGALPPGGGVTQI